MNISVPATLQEFIERKVSNGEFQSPDDVVCEGLKLLQKQDEWKADLRATIDEGWQQAQRGDTISGEESHRRIRELSEKVRGRKT